MLVLGILGFLVSILALVVSAWAAMSSRRTANHQNQLQERLLVIEQRRDDAQAKAAQRANVRAEIHAVGGGEWQVYVMNEGPATARNIRLEFDGAPFLVHPWSLRGQDEVTKLGHGAFARYLLAPTQGAPSSAEARITWDDDAGSGRTWESQLTLKALRFAHVQNFRR